MHEARGASDAIGQRISLLDVGDNPYADAILCQLGGYTILIDGAHKGDDVGTGDHDPIPEQLRQLTGTARGPVALDLLIVTHLHDDHIGCLPDLVGNRVVTAKSALVLDPKWRWQQGVDAVAGDAVTIGARQVALAIGEEPRAPTLSDAELLSFLADAATLDSRYASMLDELNRQGHVYLYGSDDTKPLATAFAGIGLQLVGPSPAQLELTRKKIQSDAADAFEAAADALRVDATRSVADLYRRVLFAKAGGEDATDGRGGPGASINLQSIVTLFRFDKRKALLTGDMQLADPESRDPELRAEVDALLQRIATDAPYDFFKLPHHGSWNGFDQTLFDALGATRHFGISAGAKSKAHPDRTVLELLADHRPAVQWARTDRNRLSTFSFGTAVRLAVENGHPNDRRGPSPDALVPSAPTAELSLVSAVAAAEPGGDGGVEVITRIYRSPARVHLTIEVDGAAPVVRDTTTAVSAQHVAAAPLPALRVAGGRSLPKLLAVTSAAGLARNIGASEAREVLDGLRSAGLRVFDSIPAGETDAAAAVASVNAEVRRHPDLAGVLIVGGYDVVPAARVDCLDPDLRRAVEANVAAGAERDLDDNIVWSDDAYAGGDPGDPLPDLPLSRIPDGASGALLFRALSAGTAVGPARSGIRNVLRPFAEPIFGGLPGSATMGISAPLTDRDDPPYAFAQWAYFMLHGSSADTTRFWGDDPATHTRPTAFDIRLVPNPAPEVVFAGCCWGALTVVEKASDLQRGRVPSIRGPRDSIALAFLNAGSLAFVGCTGSHYSPTAEPFTYAGGPMHTAFWGARRRGRNPAQALFEAKVAYLRGIPHGQNRTMARASEAKTFYQFTCLGLGW